MVAENFSLKVETHVSSFGYEFEAFLDFPYDPFPIPHSHNKSSFTPEEG